MCYGVLRDVSIDYPPVTGMLLTRYSPFRRSPPGVATRAAPRLACVKPAASVHPEPGSNSSLYILYITKLVPDTRFFKETDARLLYVLLVLVRACLYFLSVFSMISFLRPPLGLGR